VKKIDWTKNQGLVPAIVQDADTGRVLMLAYMNEQSLKLTEEKGLVTFYSRSRGELWTKGETSGNFLKFVAAEVDCDGDTFLIQARPQGPVCHEGTETCFGDEAPESPLVFLAQLQKVIDSRFEKSDADKSYIAKLIEKGPDRMAQKVGEEAVETVIASKNADLALFEGEAADLLFHLMVLLKAKGSSLAKLTDVLKSRHK
jgi:phosphoribosyl-AMP cyclohydrolase / phosphoribosyl-ATP pyrophosphohydrolase